MDNSKTHLKEAEALSPNAIETALAQCTPTETENLYRAQEFEFDPNKPTAVIIIGPSGAGKDMVTLGATEREEFSRAVTATSRGRQYQFLQSHLEKAKSDGGVAYAIARISDLIDEASGPQRAKLVSESIQLGWLDEELSEPEDAYVWMRQKKPTETDKEYSDELIKEYELIEHDHHHGNHYGLPAVSLKRAIDSEKVPVIRTEPAGAKTIQKNLALSHNILIIGILPEDEEKMLSSINGREHVEKRLRESLQIINEIPDLAHFVIHNLWGKQEETIHTFINLVNYVTKEVPVR